MLLYALGVLSCQVEGSGMIQTSLGAGSGCVALAWHRVMGLVESWGVRFECFVWALEAVDRNRFGGEGFGKVWGGVWDRLFA